MQNELQTALFQAFDTLNLQRVKTFSVPPVTLCGLGAVSSCGQQAQTRRLKHLFVMADSFLHQAGMTAGLTRSLAVKGIAMTLWLCPVGEPCITDVCAAVAQLRESGCDGVIAFGGGSVLDAAKAVALLVTNPDSTLAEMSETSVLQPRLPLIAIPTTAGTGSETTNVTVIIDAVSGRKQVLAHASLMPDVAILDAALTEGVPSHVTAMTGIDALTHAIEAYSALNATPFTDSLAIGAIAMIGKSLPKAVGYGHDPVALGIIEPSDRRYLALGVLAGIVTIPIGCIAGGLVAMYSGVQINGQPVEFTFALILMNMIPVIIVAILVALGLKFIPEKMINGFQIFAKFLVALITLGLAAAVVKFLLGWELIPGLDPIFMAPGDKPGEVMRAIEVIGSISCVLLGAYPMVLLLTRWFEKPLMSVGKVLNMNNIAAAGMVATLANNIPMFGMMKQMDTRGKVINCAFAVSAAFALGDHLGFAAANMNAMIFPMIVGKLIGGVTAIGVAMMLVPKEDATATKTEAEAQS
ncbi:ethanolamine utilization ethanol dehydrogenase EutG [Escherichia coli]|nr:ethanolamine utilization ethanol dehydrogenase EutG [Escherichia coli]MCW9806132.1 ethanolamine utilization ethanol dehydrogenase EutG [Escherichia coli]